MPEQLAMYKCDKCGATFKDADALTKHKLIHSQTRKQEGGGKKATTTPKPPLHNPPVPPLPPVP